MFEQDCIFYLNDLLKFNQAILFAILSWFSAIKIQLDEKE